MRVLPVIVGAAGHVDHGKTSLVGLLSNRETDTLAEERARGMSIDMSVVPLSLSNGDTVGLVDVPGHRDYIRNSVAGISAIDVLLLVVAADDGVMPQTVEHVKAAHYFGASRVVVAINKIDLVDEETVALVQVEVDELLTRYKFYHRSVVWTSCSKGTGIEEVREAISRSVAELSPSSPDCKGFRMSVRKGFPVKGLGVVITGIPSSGRVQIEQELEVLPTAQRFRVKGIQQYRGKVEVGDSRISTAINTRDISAEELERGSTVAEPGLYEAVSQAYVTLGICAPKTEVKSGARAMFYSGCVSVTAQLRPIDTARISEGQEAICLIKFPEPVVVTTGDRFILRNPNRGDILGGGIVLAAGHLRTGKLTDELLDLLLSAKLAVEENNLPLATMLLTERVIHTREGVSRLLHQSDIEDISIMLRLGSGAAKTATHYLFERRMSEVITSLSHFLRGYHQRNKLVWGAKPELVAELLQIPVEVLRELLGLFAKTNAGVEIKHGRVALGAFSPKISARDISLREKLLSDLHRREQPAVARGDAQKFLDCTEQELKRILSLLVDENEIKIIGNNLFSVRLYEQCISVVQQLGTNDRVIDLAAFREQSGLSRNMAVSVLDELDGRGITFRVGGERKLRGAPI